MNVLDTYKLKQEKTIGLLKRLLSFLKEGEKFDFVLDQATLAKLQTAINDAESEKLKIVFIGGYKEGKTSIVSAWTGNYDEEEMNISSLEATYSINSYELSEEYSIVDTPGLFGFKETDDKEKYKDITKKYVSEADLIIYVMGSDNPIKDSHKEDLIWLFKELNLLPRTVFVLSRFDEATDIEDDEEFYKALDTKKESIKKRLVEFGIIDSDYEPLVVAVSAKPFEKKIQEWMDEDPDEYKRISHINDLQNASSKIINDLGGSSSVVLGKQQSIISDVLYKRMPDIEKKIKTVNHETEELNKLCLNAEKDYNSINSKISKTRISLREFIMDYFTDLIMQAKKLSVDSIDEFFETEIGSEGIVIQTKIENEFDRQTGGITGDISNCELSLNNGITRYNNVVGSLAMDGLKGGSNYLKTANITVSNAQVLAVRDVLFKNVKFKPWGAVKLAKNISKGISYFGAFLGIGLEVWDAYNEVKKKEEVEKAKAEMVANFEEQRKEYINLLNDDTKFAEQFFPGYKAIKDRVSSLKEDINNKYKYIADFAEWKKEGEIIDADFKVIAQ